MKSGIHCEAPNSEGWFFCRSCGKRASATKFTTNLWMMSETGKRTDVEFSPQTMGESIKEMRKNRYA